MFTDPTRELRRLLGRGPSDAAIEALSQEVVAESAKHRCSAHVAAATVAARWTSRQRAERIRRLGLAPEAVGGPVSETPGGDDEQEPLRA